MGYKAFRDGYAPVLDRRLGRTRSCPRLASPPSSLVPPRLPLTAMHEEEAPRLETTASLLPGECTRTQRHPAPRFAGNDALYEQQDA